VDAEFFILAFSAAANPKLLAIDLLLIENERPRAMFMSILAGGMSLAIAIGLVDVLVVRADAIKKQGSVSAGVDLAIGVILLVLGVLVAAGWPRRRRKSTPKAKKNGWAQKLREPRLGLAFGIGALVGLPGASYITALHNLVAGKYSTATQVGAVFVFVIIEFLLIIIPWACLELWPQRTAAALRGSQAWIASHARKLLAWTALVLGTYLVISALVRLL
jgi:hypothetical protein